VENNDIFPEPFFVPPLPGETLEDYEWRILEKTVSKAIRDLYDRHCFECPDAPNCVLGPQCAVLLTVWSPKAVNPPRKWIVHGNLLRVQRR